MDWNTLDSYFESHPDQKLAAQWRAWRDAPRWRLIERPDSQTRALFLLFPPPVDCPEKDHFLIPGQGEGFYIPAWLENRHSGTIEFIILLQGESAPDYGQSIFQRCPAPKPNELSFLLIHGSPYRAWHRLRDILARSGTPPLVRPDIDPTVSSFDAHLESAIDLIERALNSAMPLPMPLAKANTVARDWLFKDRGAAQAAYARCTAALP